MIQNLLENTKKIHFIGVGGIGVSALAKILHFKGAQISGSDSTQNGQTIELSTLCQNISIGHSESNISNQNLIIYSLAIPKTNPELLKAQELGIPCLTYPEALGQLTKNYKLIAIAGTHGKTTTTGMLLKVFIELGLDPTGIIGTTTNILNGENYRVGKSEWFILEACEYHQGFLNLNPDYTLITNVEHDHFDAYPTKQSYLDAFQQLCEQTKNNVILNIDFELSTKIKSSKVTSYSKPDYKIELNIPGIHNQINANGVLTLTKILNLPQEKVLQSLSDFSGTDRRLQIIKQTATQTIYDDYGHHPTEIKATVQALQERHPNQEICIIYQPHQFNRTIALIDEFIEVFEQANKVIVTDIYAARDSQQDKDQMPAGHFADLLKSKNPNVVFGESIQNTYQNFAELTKNYPIVVIMGAGNIEELANLIKSSDN